MIDAKIAERDIATGLSAICAYCENWHDAKERGDKVKCHEDCGGPATGRGFPKYKGPLEGHLAKVCFICGCSATAGVEIGGRMIGVCDRMGPHKETCMDKLKRILTRAGVVAVKETVVPVIGGGE